MTKERNDDEALRDNLSKAAQSGLAGRYYRRLQELADEDASTIQAGELPDMKAVAYIARRALNTADAAGAEIPLVFRRVHEHGDANLTKGLEMWKVDPATQKRVPNSGLILAVTDEKGELIPKNPFTEEDVQTALEGIEVQSAAGLSFDGPPGFAVVPQSMIDAGIE